MSRITVALSTISCIRERDRPVAECQITHILKSPLIQPRLAYSALELITGFPLTDKHQTGIGALLWHAGEKNIENLQSCMVRAQGDL